MRSFCLFCLVGALALPAFGQLQDAAPPLRQAEDLVKTGHFDEALQKLDTLAAEQPEPAGIEYLRGMVFYQQSKMADAADRLRKSCYSRPKESRSHADAGREFVSPGETIARRSRCSNRHIVPFQMPTSSPTMY